MKKKIILRSIILLVLGVIIYESFSIYEMITCPEEVLEDIKTIDVFNNKDKAISIMVQDTNSDKWTEATDRSSWPSSTTHGFVGAECTDSDGATLKWEDILTFSLTNHTATLKTKQTVYCTLYFARGTPALDWLKQKGGNYFGGGSAHSTVVDGMYRFKGTAAQVTNNYICFGTNVLSTCTGNPDTYMYRIIGITSAADSKIGLSANQLKIIKATPFGTTAQQWHNTNSSNTLWDTSTLKTYLNGTSNNTQFLYTIKNGTDGTYWDSMITSHKWYNADYTNVPAAEPTTSITTSNSKIGLMYATDYKNSGDQNTNNWLYVKNGWSTSSAISESVAEWTMTRTGHSSSNNNAWYVTNDGVLTIYTFTHSLLIRPVFYIQAGVNLTGSGTATDPYRITTMNDA